jgi:dTDP-4-dehydrorhamnose 3,5-epimerase
MKKKLINYKLIENKKHKDNRGDFYRFFCEDISKNLNLNSKISQVSISKNLKKGTIRGLHYQLFPNTEAKYISCIQGSLFDIIVDIRKQSKNFMKVYQNILAENDSKVLFVPEGFAHGFQTLKNNTIIIYGMTKPYSKNHQSGIRYDDPKLKIKWPIKKVIISKKDEKFKNIL